MNNLIQTRKDFLAKLDSRSDFITTILEKTYSGISGIQISPRGGESYGSYSATAIECTQVKTAEEAVVALWKLAWCLTDELHYGNWDLPTIEFQRQNFHDSYSHWLHSDNESVDSDRKSFLQWIQSMVNANLEGQRAIENPRKIFSYPDALTINPKNLESSQYLVEKNIYMILSNKWNSIEGLFCFDGYFVLAFWGTSA